MPVQESLGTSHILGKLIWSYKCHDTIDPGSKISEMIQNNSTFRKLFKKLKIAMNHVKIKLWQWNITMIGQILFFQCSLLQDRHPYTVDILYGRWLLFKIVL